MAVYALHWIAHFQRGFDVRFEASAINTWGERDTPTPPEYPVGILGFGSIGRGIGAAFQSLGHPVNAWTRSGTDADGVTSYAGTDELEAFLAALIVVILLGAFEFAAIGLLVGSRARTAETASGLMNLVMLPMWTLSGIFFSYERFPELFHPVIRLLPLTPVIDALRAIMSDGKGLIDVLPEIGVMAVWCVIPFFLALAIFRWND